MSKYSKYILTILAIVFMGQTISFSQNNTSYQFNGRLENEGGENPNNLVVEIKVKKEGEMNWENPFSDIAVDYDGAFNFGVPKKIYAAYKDYQVTIKSEEWRIVEPKNGRIEKPSVRGESNDLYEKVFYVEKVKKISRQSEQLMAQNKNLKKEIAEKDQAIEKLSAQLSDMENNQGAISDSLQKVREKYMDEVAGLKKEIENLTQNLSDNRRQIQTDIRDSTIMSLRRYLDDLKDLNDKLTPHHIQNAFFYQASRNDLEKFINQYNSTRKFLKKKGDVYVGYLKDPAYWDTSTGEILAIDLNNIYSLALDDISEDILVPLTQSISQSISDYGSKRKPRIAMQRKAKKAVKKAKPELSKKIMELENEINALVEKLNTL